MKEIFERRSVRKFLDKKIEDEKIEKLLRAAMAAPSAGNQQEWEFIVVDDKALLSRLSQVSPYAGCFKDAGLGLVLLANTSNMRHKDYYEQDLAAATENLLLEAQSLDLGAVWLGVAPLEDRMMAIKEIFNLPEEVLAFALVAVGYPTEELPPVDRFEPKKIHYNSY